MAPDGDDGIGIVAGAEVVDALEEAGEARGEAESLVAGEGAVGRGAVEPLRRQDVEHLRRQRIEQAVVVRPAPVRVHRILTVIGRIDLAGVDVGHRRPQPRIVDAELLLLLVDLAVVRAAMAQPDDVPDLVDQSVPCEAAAIVGIGGDRAVFVGARVDRDSGAGVRAALQDLVAADRHRSADIEVRFGRAGRVALQGDVGGGGIVGQREGDVGQPRPEGEGTVPHRLLGVGPAGCGIEPVFDGPACRAGRCVTPFDGLGGRIVGRRPVLGVGVVGGGSDLACVVDAGDESDLGLVLTEIRHGRDAPTQNHQTYPPGATVCSRSASVNSRWRRKGMLLNCLISYR